jgi:hypothetical protein
MPRAGPLMRTAATELRPPFRPALVRANGIAIVVAALHQNRKVNRHATGAEAAHRDGISLVFGGGRRDKTCRCGWMARKPAASAVGGDRADSAPDQVQDDRRTRALCRPQQHRGSLSPADIYRISLVSSGSVPWHPRTEPQLAVANKVPATSTPAAKTVAAVMVTVRFIVPPPVSGHLQVKAE